MNKKMNNEEETYTDRVQRMRRETREGAEERGRKFVKDVVATLEESGHTVTLAPKSNGLAIMEVDNESISFVIYAQKNHNTYDYTGKLRCLIGRYYGDKKNYPEPNKGFNVQVAVDRILARVENNQRKRRYQEKMDEKYEAQKATLARAKKLIGLDENSSGYFKCADDTIYIKTHSPEKVAATIRFTPEELAAFTMYWRERDGRRKA